MTKYISGKKSVSNNCPLPTTPFYSSSFDFLSIVVRYISLYVYVQKLIKTSMILLE